MATLEEGPELMTAKEELGGCYLRTCPGCKGPIPRWHQGWCWRCGKRRLASYWKARKGAIVVKNDWPGGRERFTEIATRRSFSRRPGQE